MKKSARGLKILSLLVVLLLFGQTFAGAYCAGEYVDELIVHNNGNVYFKTTKSCPNWCLVNPNWSSEQKDRAYAMLLAAYSSSKPLTLYWPQHTSNCQNQVAVYSIPELFMLER